CRLIPFRLTFFRHLLGLFDTGASLVQPAQPPLDMPKFGGRRRDALVRREVVEHLLRQRRQVEGGGQIRQRIVASDQLVESSGGTSFGIYMQYCRSRYGVNCENN